MADAIFNQNNHGKCVFFVANTAYAVLMEPVNPQIVTMWKVLNLRYIMQNYKKRLTLPIFCVDK